MTKLALLVLVGCAVDVPPKCDGNACWATAQCVPEPTDACVKISPELSAWACNDTEPDPVGMSCFHLDGWISGRCCVMDDQK